MNIIKRIGNIYRKFSIRQQRGVLTPTTCDTDTTNRCLNCGNLFVGNYCNRCGQAFIKKSQDNKQVTKDLFIAATNFDPKFFFTSFELLFRPGYLIRDYLRGKRVRYINPFFLLFILSTFYMLLATIMGQSGEISPLVMSSISIELPDMPETQHLQQLLNSPMAQLILRNKALLILFSLPLWVAAMKMAFCRRDKKKAMGVIAWTVTQTYISCLLLLVSILFQVFSLLTLSGKTAIEVPLWLLLVIHFVALVQLLGGKKISLFFRLLLAYILYLTMMVCVLLLLYIIGIGIFME